MQENNLKVVFEIFFEFETIRSHGSREFKEPEELKKKKRRRRLYQVHYVQISENQRSVLKTEKLEISQIERPNIYTDIKIITFHWKLKARRQKAMTLKCCIKKGKSNNMVFFTSKIIVQRLR